MKRVDGDPRPPIRFRRVRALGISLACGSALACGFVSSFDDFTGGMAGDGRDGAADAGATSDAGCNGCTPRVLVEDVGPISGLGVNPDAVVLISGSRVVRVARASGTLRTLSEVASADGGALVTGRNGAIYWSFFSAVNSGFYGCRAPCEDAGFAPETNSGLTFLAASSSRLYAARAIGGKQVRVSAVRFEPAEGRYAFDVDAGAAEDGEMTHFAVSDQSVFWRLESGADRACDLQSCALVRQRDASTPTAPPQAGLPSGYVGLEPGPADGGVSLSRCAESLQSCSAITTEERGPFSTRPAVAATPDGNAVVLAGVTDGVAHVLVRILGGRSYEVAAVTESELVSALATDGSTIAFAVVARGGRTTIHRPHGGRTTTRRARCGRATTRRAAAPCGSPWTASSAVTPWP